MESHNQLSRHATHIFLVIVNKTDEVAGSPHWMAPEVVLEKVPNWRIFFSPFSSFLLFFSSLPHLLLLTLLFVLFPSQDYDARCDIWSMGITAIEMAEVTPYLEKKKNAHPNNRDCLRKLK